MSSQTSSYKGFSAISSISQDLSFFNLKKNKGMGEKELFTQTNLIPIHGQKICSPIYLPPPLIIYPHTKKLIGLNNSMDWSVWNFFRCNQEIYKGSKLWYANKKIDGITDSQTQNEINTFLSNTILDNTCTNLLNLYNTDFSLNTNGTIDYSGIFYSNGDLNIVDGNNKIFTFGTQRDTFIFCNGNLTIPNLSFGTPNLNFKIIIICTGSLTITNPPLEQTEQNYTPPYNRIFIACNTLLGINKDNYTTSNGIKKTLFINDLSQETVSLTNEAMEHFMPGDIVKEDYFSIFSVSINLSNPIIPSKLLLPDNNENFFHSYQNNGTQNYTIKTILFQTIYQYRVIAENIDHDIIWTFGDIKKIMPIIFTEQNITPNFRQETESSGIKFFIENENYNMLQTFRMENNIYKPVGNITISGPNFMGFYMTINNFGDISISNNSYEVFDTQPYTILSMFDKTISISGQYRQKTSSILQDDVFLSEPNYNFIKYYPFGCDTDIIFLKNENPRCTIKSFQGSVKKSKAVRNYISLNNPIQTPVDYLPWINALLLENFTIVYADQTKIKFVYNSDIKTLTIPDSASFSENNDTVFYYISNTNEYFFQVNGNNPGEKITFTDVPENYGFNMSVIFPDTIVSSIQTIQISNKNFNYTRKEINLLFPFVVDQTNIISPDTNKIEMIYLRPEEIIALKRRGFIENTNERLLERFREMTPDPDYVLNLVIQGKVTFYTDNDETEVQTNLLDGQYNGGNIVVTNGKTLKSNFPFVIGDVLFTIIEREPENIYDDEFNMSLTGTINYIKNLSNPLFIKDDNKNYRKIVKIENSRVVLDNIIIINPLIPTIILIKNNTESYKFIISTD